MTTLKFTSFVLLYIHVIFVTCQENCYWCSYNVLPPQVPYPLYVPVGPPPVPFMYHSPHHLEYSYSGFEPRHPNYLSYVYEDVYAPNVFQHGQQQSNDGARSASIDNRHSAPQQPASHLDYFMNLDNYEINHQDDSAEPSWEPIDDFFLSILDRYTRFWRRYRNDTDIEDPTEEEIEADKEVERSDNILNKVDEKFQTIDRLFEHNHPTRFKLQETLNGLEKIISESVIR